jgi:MFS family permease
MTSVTIGMVSSIYTIGGLIGALPAGMITAKYGRVLPMRINTLIATIGSAAEAFAPSIPVLAAGRFISGIAAGSSTVIVPLYISEISPPNQRGFFGAFTQISTNFGIFVTQLIGYFLSHGQYWRIILASAGFIALAQLVALSFAVESPIWAAENGMKPQAKEILRRLRGEDYDLREEVSSMRGSSDQGRDEEQTLLSSGNDSGEQYKGKTQSVGFFEILTKKDYLPAVVAVIATMMAQQLCGKY